METPQRRPAVFLDRDGTINVEIAYLGDPARVALEAGVGPAIARLNRAGLPVLVITNQAGIARGYYDLAAMHTVHQRISELLRPDGAHIDGWYFCPHHPDLSGPCACRKPGIALLEQAAAEHQVELARSWMAGDKQLDVAAGLAAGCRAILITTGYGAQERAAVGAAVPVVASLGAAVDLILAQEAGHAA